MRHRIEELLLPRLRPLLLCHDLAKSKHRAIKDRLMNVHQLHDSRLAGYRHTQGPLFTRGASPETQINVYPDPSNQLLNVPGGI